MAGLTARRVRRQIGQRHPTAVDDLDEELDAFARALAALATRARP